MKILCVGDSWTYGYDDNGNINKNKKNWPNILAGIIDADVEVNSKCGAANNEIFSMAGRGIKNYDIIIIGWSGCTRHKTPRGLMEFSCAETSRIDKYRMEYFKDKSLYDLLLPWDDMMDKLTAIGDAVGTRVIHFNVFGDKPIRNHSNFLNLSFLEFLAKKQNMPFSYDIPIFEFDFLREDNANLIEPFAKKYFPHDWKLAIIEREDVRPGKYFLACGHPNEAGHNAWAEHIAAVL